MTLVIIGLAAATMLVMAMVMSFVLGWANRAFHVEVDPRVEQSIEALPGANCGGCGYIGCSDYAEAVVGGAAVNRCPVGGESCAQALAAIMGVEVGEALPFRPVVHCGAHTQDKLLRHDYRGERRCSTANLVANVQGCTYGCLGIGDCADACKYGALTVIDGLSTVDYDKCIGCGACAKVCPRNIITMVPFKAEWMYAVTCSNKDSAKDVKQVCLVGCMGCKACTRVCNLFAMEGNVSRIDYDAYDIGVEQCILDLEKACEKCPSKRILKVGKPSKADLEAVKDKEAPTLVEPDFKTSIDDTEWQG